jgi:hypothetical protein
MLLKRSKEPTTKLPDRSMPVLSRNPSILEGFKKITMTSDSL